MTDIKDIRVIKEHKTRKTLSVSLPRSSGFLPGQRVLVVVIDDYVDELIKVVKENPDMTPDEDTVYEIPLSAVKDPHPPEDTQPYGLVGVCNQCGGALKTNRKCALGHPN